jgi:hypothetical protein
MSEGYISVPVGNYEVSFVLWHPSRWSVAYFGPERIYYDGWHFCFSFGFGCISASWR